MSSITWSFPANISASVSSNQYWQTSQDVIRDFFTNTPKLIIPGVNYRRKISIMLQESTLSEEKSVRMWINPPNGFAQNLGYEELAGHLQLYSSQNVAELEISDPVWFATNEPDAVYNQYIVVKWATLIS